MKNIFLFFFVAVFFSCNKEESINEVETNQKKVSFKVIGNGYDLNINLGTRDRQLNEYSYNGAADNTGELINLFSEVGMIPETSAGYFVNEEGITILEYNGGDGNTIIHHKNYETQELFQNTLPVIEKGESSYLHYNNSFYLLYQKSFSYDANDETIEYKLRIIDMETNQESEISVGRFKIGQSEKLQVKLAGDILYFLRLPSFVFNEGEISLVAINLNTLEIINNKGNFKVDRFRLVPDNLSNCYLFGEEFHYRFNFLSNTLEELNIPGQTFYISSAFDKPGTEEIVINNKVVTFISGPQPSNIEMIPLVYDLGTGDVILIQINDVEPIQFEGDEYPFQPVTKCFTVDVENETILIGAENNLGGPFKSQGVFTLDFMGITVDKRKIPILPLHIIN